MRHHNANRKFGLKSNVRKALIRSLAVALVTKGKITTTTPKAKELRPFIEKLITKAKPGTLSAERLVMSRIGVRAGAKLVKGIAPKYATVSGGYTRITHLPRRKSDGSEMAVIEFV